MKGLTSSVTRALTTGSYVACQDNSGAKEIFIIGIPGMAGTRRRNAGAGVGTVVTASVKKGNPDMIKKVVKAVIIRQKKEFRRPNGMRIMFEDNAVVLITEDGLPVGTEVKGVVAREIYERFPKVSAVSAGIL
ncbi:MAG: 50S ribosomal protein L14 [Candidatus Micrarchaeota archaeon]